MKRIVHVVGFAVRGGCETNCAVFIRHSPEFEHHVIVLGRPGPMTETWRALGAAVSHHFMLHRGWWHFYRRFHALAEALPMDAAIVWGGIRVPLVVAGLASMGCPTVLHVGNPFAQGWRVRFMLRLSACFLGRPPTVKIMACSQHVARTFRGVPYFSQFPVGVSLNPVEIPNENEHTIRVLDAASRLRIGMVARLDPIKDHATLLAAFARLRQRWPLAELHLAGDGVLRPTLEAQAKYLGIAEAVCFHGTVGDVPEFLRSLDLFCYFTTESEGMGNALAEALAHGLPSVVSELPVLREVAGEDGRAARFVPADLAVIADTVTELLGDAEGRRHLSHAAWQRAHEAFAPVKAVKSYLTALQTSP